MPGNQPRHSIHHGKNDERESWHFWIVPWEFVRQHPQIKQILLRENQQRFAVEKYTQRNSATRRKQSDHNYFYYSRMHSYPSWSVDLIPHINHPKFRQNGLIRHSSLQDQEGKISVLAIALISCLHHWGYSRKGSEDALLTWFIVIVSTFLIHLQMHRVYKYYLNVKEIEWMIKKSSVFLRG